jgi:hypothetical protein
MWRAKQFENQFSVTTKNRVREFLTRAGRPARVKVCKKQGFRSFRVSKLTRMKSIFAFETLKL